MKGCAFAGLLLGCLLAFGAPAAAQEAEVDIELNKLEAKEGACRAYLVLENGTESAFESLKLDLVMFDPEGVVAKRLAVETAPLPAGKTRLKVFDIDDLPCAEIGNLLLNGVLSCRDATGSRADCLALIATGSRDARTFIK